MGNKAKIQIPQNKIEDIVRLYRDMPASKVAKETGLPTSHVRAILCRLKIKKGRKIRKKVIIDLEQLKIDIQTMSILEISKDYKCKPYDINTFIRKNNIEIPKKPRIRIKNPWNQKGWNPILGFMG